MPLESEVEAAKPVPGQRISPTLQHNSTGLVHLHHLGNHRLEDLLIRFIIDPITQGKVHSVILAFASTNVLWKGRRFVLIQHTILRQILCPSRSSVPYKFMRNRLSGGT